LLSKSIDVDLFLSRQPAKTDGFGSGVQQNPEAARGFALTGYAGHSILQPSGAWAK
jgi:hypothetical protein